MRMVITEINVGQWGFEVKRTKDAGKRPLRTTCKCVLKKIRLKFMKLFLDPLMNNL